MLRQRIIDAHSHIGVDRFWKVPADLSEYITYAKQIGITDSILMPTTCPVLTRGHEEVTQALWEYTNTGFSYYKETIGKNKEPIYQNPFKVANQLLYQTIMGHCNEDINLYFVPIIHPALDTVEYIEQLITRYKPIALKIHGIATGISPKNIDSAFWDIIKKFNIPLIVHTDIDMTDKDTPIKILRNLNSPLEWIQVLQENNIRAYLAHGVRLCPDSCKIVNESNNFLVGIGPDALITKEKERLFSKEPYLLKLFSSIDLGKICFDLDYSWNVSDGVLEWNSLKRVRTLGLTDSELEKVLCNNARDFYGL